MENEEIAPAIEEALGIDPVKYDRSTVQFLMFYSAWSSYKKGDLVFELITPEVGTQPFRLIAEEDEPLDFTSFKPL